MALVALVVVVVVGEEHILGMMVVVVVDMTGSFTLFKLLNITSAIEFKLFMRSKTDED